MSPALLSRQRPAGRCLAVEHQQRAGLLLRLFLADRLAPVDADPSRLRSKHRHRIDVAAYRCRREQTVDETGAAANGATRSTIESRWAPAAQRLK
jgi:hypothetical protein